MSIILLLITVLLLAVLLCIAAIQPRPATSSVFELRRRQRLRDTTATEALRRETLIAQASVLGVPFRAILLILISAVLLYQLDWLMGLPVALFVGLTYNRVAHISFLQDLSNALYRKYESHFLDLASKYKKAIRFVGGKKLLEERVYPIGSREELAYLLEQSPVFSDEDTNLLKNTFRFKERTVEELMTPKEKVITVDDSELLGPLVLDDLHKTGHTIFPVVKDKAVVGLLDSSDHVDLHAKESVHVRSVMHTDIAKVSEDMTLDTALRTLLTTKEQLMIVVDDDEQLIGIVSLKDIVRALIG